MNEKNNLIEHLIHNTGVIEEGSRIESAFNEIDRKDFIAEEYHPEAYEDYPLPIGYDQTISQPTTVAFMLSLLNPEKGDRILDVGCGSGWTTVLLGYLTGETGEVIGIDVIDDFVEITKERLAEYGDFAPKATAFDASLKEVIFKDRYDKILVNAGFESMNKIPSELISNLENGGVMVAPVGNEIIKFRKEKDGLNIEKRYEGFRFVPYV